ncbi:hypothetical protein LTR70_001323 [Exophiala xenobiotica]|uniref:Uncharacterized protein n=1 Tax=Lithohypha guttulata TaxID=1690604 RepID=A0ABR0KMU3_9EURO|nr:hypothetical protein LTR24_000921 [Lithohypha guttulata]KAK5328002.1 hypothetical protein LTR70_001323 [Exophiala xenobiotica]
MAHDRSHHGPIDDVPRNGAEWIGEVLGDGEDIGATTLLTHIKSHAHTWGVELEFVFAFHKKRLERVLDTYGPNRRPGLDDPENQLAHERILVTRRRNPFDDAHEGHTTWPSWLLRVPETDQAYSLSRKVGSELACSWWKSNQYEQRNKPIYRTYFLEPLLIAQDVLYKQRLRPQIVGGKVEHNADSLGGATSVHEIFRTNETVLGQHAAFPGAELAFVAQRKDSLNYKKWMLTRDYTVYPATQREIVAALGLPDQERKLWNSDGIELVSKTYHYDNIDAGCRKLAKYLAQLGYVGNVQPVGGTTADSDGEEDDSPEDRVQWLNSAKDGMESERTWGAFDSVFAGTHVHIGLDWTPEDFEFDFLRHLGFLLVSNEQLISSLHAFKRRGKLTSFTPVDPVFTPNRQRTGSAEEHARTTELSEKYVSKHSIHSNESTFMVHAGNPPNTSFGSPETQQKAANFFFATNLTPTQFFDAVQRQLMNEPAHGVLVDLSRLFKHYQYSRQSPGERDGPPPICTIEFRQQGCTLDAEEVKRWVKFLFALVRLAEKRAKQTTDSFNVSLRNNAYASTVEREMPKYPSATLTMRRISISSGKR